MSVRCTLFVPFDVVNDGQLALGKLLIAEVAMKIIVQCATLNECGNPAESRDGGGAWSLHGRITGVDRRTKVAVRMGQGQRSRLRRVAHRSSL